MQLLSQIGEHCAALPRSVARVLGKIATWSGGRRGSSTRSILVLSGTVTAMARGTCRALLANGSTISAWLGRGCGVDFPDLSVADDRFRLRRGGLLRRSIRSSARWPISTRWSPAPIRIGTAGDPGLRAEPQRPISIRWFADSRPRAGTAATIGISGAMRRRAAARQTIGCRISAARPGPGTIAAANITTTRFSADPAGPELAQPGGGDGHARGNAVLAAPRRGRLPRRRDVDAHQG